MCGGCFGDLSWEEDWPLVHPREDAISILVALAATWTLMFNTSSAAFATFFYPAPSYRSPLLQLPIVLDLFSGLALILSSVLLAVRNLHLPTKKLWLGTVGVAFVLHAISLLFVLVLDILEFRPFQDIPTPGSDADVDDVVSAFSAASLAFNVVHFLWLWGFVGYCATRIYRKRWGENVLAL